MEPDDFYVASEQDGFVSREMEPDDFDGASGQEVVDVAVFSETNFKYLNLHGKASTFLPFR